MLEKDYTEQCSEWMAERLEALIEYMQYGHAAVAYMKQDGTFKLEIDEDMRQYITMKLIEALPQFPLEEMEREEKRNRDKKIIKR